MFGVGYTILVTLDSIAVNSQYRSGQKASFLGGSLLFGLSIAYSRTILGVHSWDQIIYGSSIGIWLALSTHYIIRTEMMEHLNRVL